MKVPTKRLIAASLACVAGALSHEASAQTTIGFDDYNTAVLGTDYVSRTFSPDNSGNTGFGSAPSPTFGGSFFDLWGVAQRDNGGAGPNGEPNDIFDDSAGSFPPDVIGFNSIGTDGFVVAADTQNGDNPNPGGALVRVDYVFNITGYENLQVGIDWAAFGNFETSDSFIVQAGIDGGTQSTIMEIGMTQAQDDVNTLYTSTMASGTIADIYFDPFFEQDDHDFLIANSAAIQSDGALVNPGTGNLVDFHVDDTDFDGRIDAPTALNAANTTEAYNGDGFNNQELQPYEDPLRATTDGFAASTQLDNVLTTILADVAGTGDSLELSILGATNGSVEYVIFDNVEILGDLIGGTTLLVGDADNDGDVDAFDITAVEQNFGTTGIADGSLLGDADDDGDVDAFDITAVEQNFGNVLAAPSSLSVTAVPEPTSLALLGLGGLLVARRRRSA